MKCFLSGMPDLKLGLNDKIGLEKEAQLKSRPSKRYCFTKSSIHDGKLCSYILNVLLVNIVYWLPNFCSLS